MASITSASLARPAIKGEPKLFAELRAYWHAFVAKAFNPYRPELHYMRGPGPAWRAKHMALSPAVQLMVAEIRSGKARKSSPSA
jgi:hypothetical protein